MVGRVVGGVLNLAGGLVGGLLGGQGNSGPGKSGAAPGHGGVPPGHGGTPPGHNHTSTEVQQKINDSYVPQQAQPPVDLKPRPSGERPSLPDVGNTPEITGRKGPAGHTPNISQFNPDGADEGYTNGAANCAPAVAAMVARNVGFEKGATDAALIKQLGEVGGTDHTGTSGNGMIAMFQHMGLDTNAAPGADLNWINSELQAGHHVTALGNYYQVPGHIEADKTSGHYVGITGLTKEGNYLVNDPAGSAIQMTPAEMQAFITGAPTGGFAISAWKPTGGEG